MPAPALADAEDKAWAEPAQPLAEQAPTQATRPKWPGDPYVGKCVYRLKGDTQLPGVQTLSHEDEFYRYAAGLDAYTCGSIARTYLADSRRLWRKRERFTGRRSCCTGAT